MYWIRWCLRWKGCKRSIEANDRGGTDAAGVPYAVVGGNAVAAWVTTVDAAAVRNTQDVDILLRRGDMDRAATALAGAGFTREEVLGVQVFLDGPTAKVRDSVHVLMAGEKVKEQYLEPTPDVEDSTRIGESNMRVVRLESLVRMKLTSFRDKDRTHLRDLLGIGLIDASWKSKYVPELAARLQQLIDTPEG